MWRMNSSIASIFKPEELRAARTETLDEQVKEIKAFARRATSPAKRVALSELEQRLNLWWAELAQEGLAEKPTATAA